MGSSNGVTRGQLRPYFSGRTPPFILVGTLIILIIFGFSYWSLNSQYNDLQVELHEFQDQLRVAAQKRLENERQYRSIQEQLSSAQVSSSTCKAALDKKDEELSEISEQLRDDATKAGSQVEAIRIDLEKCQEEKLKKEGECSTQQEHTKQLETENAELKQIRSTLQEKINSLEVELKQMNTQQHAEVKKLDPVQVANSDAAAPKEIKSIELIKENDVPADNKNVEPTPANPDIGIPANQDNDALGANDVQDHNPVKNNPPKEGNEVQDGVTLKNNLQQKDILLQAGIPAATGDAKIANGAQLPGLGEEQKSNLDAPPQPFVANI